MSAPVTIGNATLYIGDCREILRTLPDSSVDSVVTDPPYGLAFMGKRWDYDVPREAIWRECLRVLKPGGHLLAFAGTRTQHRMAVRIEDAGFEIRDMIAWVYGSGFPKSLDVSKAVDATILHGGSNSRKIKKAIEGRPGDARTTGLLPNNGIMSGEMRGGSTNDNPATDAARQWQGWGTALKPALEPITMARKPLIGTVAANVLAHGTGALNIDGCRVAADDAPEGRKWHGGGIPENHTSFVLPDSDHASPAGRWPANLIHDGSDEVVSRFPAAGGGFGKRGGREGATVGEFGMGATMEVVGYGDAGSAARFFYCAKASKKDRGEGNNHPTVKPTALMRYLCRLVTPPGGVVLDPFTGSGSTGKAAMAEGFRFIGIEREPNYFDIACRRIEDAQAGGG